MGKQEDASFVTEDEKSDKTNPVYCMPEAEILPEEVKKDKVGSSKFA